MPIAVAIAIALAGSVGAGERIAPGVPPQLEAYRIGPGDVLDIQVVGHEEWSLQVEVRPDGRITYPATGEIRVAGMTIRDLTQLIYEAVGPGGRHLKNPVVVINIIKRRPLVAYVLGAVGQPGAVHLPLGFETATKVLGMVGGALPEADLRHVTIFRADGTKQEVDLSAEVQKGASATTIRAGDLMLVPEAERTVVGVLGETGKTGQIMLPAGMKEIDLLTLVVQAGGLRPTADPERALILRADGRIETVALREAMKDKAKAPVLRNGDVLWVLPKPEPEEQFFALLGAVGRPGQYPYREGLTLADAVAIAGQPTAQAMLNRVTILHADGSQEMVDLSPLLSGQDTEIARKPVAAGDIILVPRQEQTYIVLGAVRSPGIFPWKEGLRLSDALARAGGPVEQVAAVSNVVLVRRVPGQEKPIVMELDARALIQGRNEAANLALLPDDTIYVPSKKEKAWREEVGFPLFLLNIATQLKYLLRR